MYPINHGGGQFSFMADHASNAGWPTEFFPDIGKFPSQLNISDSAGLEIAIIGIYAVLSGQLARNGPDAALHSEAAKTCFHTSFLERRFIMSAQKKENRKTVFLRLYLTCANSERISTERKSAENATGTGL